ncbi:leucine-rich repeat domain-containing protein [uncultured Draconibacterium sp.]|uniref:leucine-rich repeat domain-containing protein n=1 Tax=uncultured Draconibacterium sp. TaxID=1573823 RepID=UPI003217D10B
MTIGELYNKLCASYSPENLNEISGKLILLYKTKNYTAIRGLVNKISKYVNIDEENDAKCFSKLIMLYHPDKGSSIHNQLQKLFELNDYEKLQNYSHIFLLADFDVRAASITIQSMEFDAEYIWDTDTEEGYSFTDEYGEESFEEPEDNAFERSFFNLLKIREYGRTNIELPTYYLQDFEDFEMAESGLESLDGIEYCIHTKILDVSNNLLTDISNLWELQLLEELYLANNQIGYIDTLSNLSNLRIIDLSGNQIDDISALYELEQLEYVNLLGNPVPLNQIRMLEKKACVVCFESKARYHF